MNSERSSASVIRRRDFLRRAAAVSTVWAVPSILPASVFGSNAPSNRINVACIGTGNQGINILRRMIANDDVQIVSVCDVNAASYGYKSEDQYLGRLPAQKEVEQTYAKKHEVQSYKGCAAERDFREVLSRQDVDAVTIVVPDHWHGITVFGANNCRIVHNTLVIRDPENAGGGAPWIYIDNHKDGTPSSQCLIYNNIATRIIAGDGVTEGNNIATEQNDYKSLFVDGDVSDGHYDFSLKEGSPAVDAGDALYSTELDLEENSRPLSYLRQ